MDNKNNTGVDNTGYRNSGDYNSGHYNSGHYNSGDYNSGHYNSGDYNSGHYNSGHCNSGDYNVGDCNSGWFNTNEPKMRMFNKDTDMTYTEFANKGIIYPDLKVCSWIEKSKMTDKEKEEVTDWETTGGYLKTLSYKEAWAEYWARASKRDKQWFQDLPNFDAGIFMEITGIDVRENSKKEELLKKANELISKAEELKKEAEKF